MEGIPRAGVDGFPGTGAPFHLPRSEAIVADEPTQYDRDYLKSTVLSEGMQTLVIYKKKVVKQPSLLATLVLDSPARSKSGAAAAPPTVREQDITRTEENLFDKILDRQPEEDKYVIHRKLAEGGMGEVYITHDKDMRRQSILKVILPKHKDNMMLIDGFVREARITGRLEHPNIIPVHDLGFIQGYGIYFTMKHIRGESLMEVLNKLEIGDCEYNARFDSYELLNIFRKVCDAVSFAHSKNIVHRDIKPHNIMVGDYGEALLMDWGLAKMLEDEDRKSIATGLEGTFPATLDETRPGIIKGSPAYMAPEQARGDTMAVDQLSDVFLLGSTLYHLYTYFPPFLGIDIDDILANARNHMYVPPEEAVYRNRDLPDELCRIIKKAMAKEKEDRYQTVDELGAEIDDLIRGKMTFSARNFASGEYLVRDGETGEECYIIRHGRVEVSKGSGDSKVVLGVLGEGDIVGEMALITQEPRSANVVALEDTEACVLNQKLFSQNLAKLPPWMEKTIVALADRVAEGNTRITSGRVD
jgi:serine/threonine-protein kinase